MSKRVLIILAVGFIAIAAAFFLYKHELSQDNFADLEPEEIEEKPKRKTKKVENEPIKEETETGTAPGTETGTETTGTDER